MATTKTTLSGLDIALQLAGRGWYVFPCRLDKKPAIPSAHPEGDPLRGKCKGECGKLGHGFNDATNDPAAVRKLWADYGGELVGIACEMSGFFALDVDRKDGKDGDRVLFDLITTRGGGQPIECGPLQTSPSGGYHILFTLPAGVNVPNTSEKLAPGLDLRSKGYICTGSGYTWQPQHGPDCLIAPAPAWLVSMIQEVQQPTYKNGHSVTGQDAPAEYWYNRYAPLAREGNRNETLYHMGLQMSWSNVPQSEALDYARKFAGKTNLPEREALATMQSAFNAPKREPARLPGAFYARGGGGLASDGGSGQPAGGTDSVPMPPALLTELGNSRRFSAAYCGQVLHVKAWGWMAWDGQRWQADETGRVISLGKRIIDQLYSEAQDALQDAAKLAGLAQGAAEADQESIKASVTAAEKRANSLLKWAMQSQTAQKIDAMLSLAESDLPARVDDFDANPWLLNCKNGVVDLRTGQLVPHAPESRITKLAGAEYNPAAECPLWLTCLNTWFAGDAELIGFIRRAIGYALTGMTSEQALFFLYGTGKNGKSVFCEVLQALLEDYSRKTPTDTLMLKRLDEGVPNDIARLPGARAVIAAELAEGKRLNESLIKDLTGGDRIAARFLRKEFFEFTPTFKIWMYGNHKPSIRGTDEGIWRRVRLVPFVVTIPEADRDPDLINKLKAELPGILSWAVRGCLEWQAQGLGMPAAVKDATANYRAEQDMLAAFLEECCLIGPRYKVTAGDLYKAYKAWAEENGENPITNRKFSQALSERGYTTAGREGGTGRMLYAGLGLITSAAEPNL